MNNSFELRNSYEYRRRLQKALTTARERLSHEDFTAFAPQLEDKIAKVTQEIEAYETLFMAHALRAVSGYAHYNGYSCCGTVLFLKPASVRLGSPPVVPFGKHVTFWQFSSS